MILEDELAWPRPSHRKDWQGVLQSIDWPRGKLLARCGEVSLFQTSKKAYATVYGLETKRGLTREQACSCFGQSCIHQAECHSLVIE